MCSVCLCIQKSSNLIQKSYKSQSSLQREIFILNMSLFRKHMRQQKKTEMGLYDSHLVGDLSGFKINVIKSVLSVAILDVNASDKFRSSYLLSYKLMKLGRDLI